MPPRRLAALLAFLVTGLLGAPPAGAIVGGASADISAYPYQVALVQNSGTTSTNYQDQFCGGTIRDALHVVTAAHCVFDNPLTSPGQVISPSRLGVLSGTSVLDGAPDPRSNVSAVSIQPGYVSATNAGDSALITLSEALPIGSTRRPLPLVDATDWATVVPGASALVTGWGATDPNGTTYPNDLHGVEVSVLSDQTCAGEYSGYDSSAMVCAGSTAGGRDSCVGDSGGPLVRDFGGTYSDRELVGIVSFGGAICGDPTAQGVYTEVAAPAVHDFVSQALPTPAPRLREVPNVTGILLPGSQVTCDPARWSGSPRVDVQFVRTVDGVDGQLSQFGDGLKYTVRDGDVGATISCITRASNDGGTVYARSAPVGPVTSPTTAPSPTAPPAAVTAPKDSAAPVARILTARCVKLTCTLTLNVTDAGFSAGIAKVTGSLRSTYRRSCVKNGRRTTCARHRSRTFTARRTAATRFTVKLTKLPVGTQLFTLLATDKAGHKQLLPTRRTLKTTRR